MTFWELMSIRMYLSNANIRLTELEQQIGIDTKREWLNNGLAWDIVRDYMEEHLY